MEIKLGNIVGTNLGSEDRIERLTMLLWGAIGVGKTVYACSAPGHKLVILFDPDGANSLGNRSDVTVVDFSRENRSIAEKFKQRDPIGLDKLLTEQGDSISTVIIDSATAFMALALEAGVATQKDLNILKPTQAAYGARNTLTLRLISDCLAITGKHKKHLIVITHDAPVSNSEGDLLYTSLMLGGKLTNLAGSQISEVWRMSDAGKARKIQMRSTAMYKPMKTRMFDTSAKEDFTLLYDQAKALEQAPNHSLEQFYLKWKENGYQKILPPNN